MPKACTREDWLTDDRLAQLEQWARSGLTDTQIAHNMGIGRSTLHRWKTSEAVIAAALRRGKTVADLEVEGALFRRATGYDATEERIDCEGGIEIRRTTTRRHIPPDTVAAIFWLKNRRPDKWRDKQQVEAEVDSEIRINWGDGLSDLAQ